MKVLKEQKVLLTPWGETLDRERPWQEYPRPQLVRRDWQCLNGVWEYAFSPAEEPETYDGEIVVPFSPESPLSGVGKQLEPGETLWYRRKVSFEPAAPEKSRLLLHFGAVDQHCKVYLNGREAGSHDGGYWPFSFDVTELVQEGENLLTLAVTDDSDRGDEAWGKQRLERGNIWYTAQSGIWQTVWCEWVPENYVNLLRITPHFGEETVEIEVQYGGTDTPETEVRILARGELAAKGFPTGGKVTLPLPGFRPWTPEDPFLYDVEVIAGADRVTSYFGMREFSLVKDGEGHTRLGLNGKPLFHTGLLDQGYWSDGLYTPPSDEAVVWELQTLKDMGFNMLRKHIKVEPLRWYYHCDRLGILVWQDFVSGGGPYGKGPIRLAGDLEIHRKDTDHASFGRASQVSRGNYYRDMKRTVSLLYNAPCIALWVPFNEGWGQFDSLRVEALLRRLDPTRLIDHASGWHDQGGGDLHSRHVYRRKFRLQKDRRGRALALTEFGGYSLPVEGHMTSEDLFGYKGFRTKEELEAAVCALYTEEIIANAPLGLCASVYTQVSDVEDEINGLFTFDRREVKFGVEFFRELNRQLTE